MCVYDKRQECDGIAAGCRGFACEWTGVERLTAFPSAQIEWQEVTRGARGHHDADPAHVGLPGIAGECVTSVAGPR